MATLACALARLLALGLLTVSARSCWTGSRVLLEARNDIGIQTALMFVLVGSVLLVAAILLEK
jgi:hypothetical protein